MSSFALGRQPPRARTCKAGNAIPLARSLVPRSAPHFNVRLPVLLGTDAKWSVDDAEAGLGWAIVCLGDGELQRFQAPNVSIASM
jgi:hypothetical protein